MKTKYIDVVDAATDDVRGWFGACESEAECAELAKDMKDVIDTIAATNAEWLSRPNDMYDFHADARQGCAVCDAVATDTTLGSSESHEDGRWVGRTRSCGYQMGTR